MRLVGSKPIHDGTTVLCCDLKEGHILRAIDYTAPPNKIVMYYFEIEFTCKMAY